MPDDLLAHIDAMLTREMSNAARFLAEVRRLSAITSNARTVLPCKCPNGHSGALYYMVPDIVRCPLCGIHDVAKSKTVELL